MFTGLVEGTGEVLYIRREGRECRFSFRPPFACAGLENGESIAVNGACLSVESHDAHTFTAYASEETMARTNLAFLANGAKVNLERALVLGARLGGHLVSGHVDCLAKVAEMQPVGQSIRYTLSFPMQFGDQIIPKGSVALDGVSLTINVCGKDYLQVNIIPDTRAKTTIEKWRPGYDANMETDLIGKYVIGLARPWAKEDLAANGQPARQPLTMDFLGKNGFL